MQTHLTVNRMIADWQKRGVSARIEHTTETVGTTVVPTRKIWLQGSQLPHDLDGVKRFRDQLLRLADEGKTLGASVPAARQPQHRFQLPPQRLVFRSESPIIATEEAKAPVCTPMPQKPLKIDTQAPKLPQKPRRRLTPRIEQPSARRVIDEKGNRYGRLLVVAMSDERTDHRQIKWICHCDCGNTAIVTGHLLRRPGGTRSCGCLHKEVMRGIIAKYQKKKEERESILRLRMVSEGEVFGEWTVLVPQHSKKSYSTFALCRCSCGTERSVKVSTLLTKTKPSRSCGHTNKGHALYDWSTVDFTRPVKQIAQEMKCAETTVRCVKRKLRSSL